MTIAAASFPLIGSQPVGNFFTTDTTQRHVLGSMISVNDPYWGGQELVYLQYPASAVIAVGTIMTWDKANLSSAVANTANLGVPLAIALNSCASSASAQYGWFLVKGVAPVLCGANVAADTAFGITAAGKGGAIANGKQILNAIIRGASSTTVAKSNTVTLNGSPVIRVSNSDGWFVGLPVSGTGIAASSTISSIDPSGTIVTLNNNATATGSVTVTGTYNDGSANYWNVAIFDRPFAQGQVT